LNKKYKNHSLNLNISIVNMLPNILETVYKNKYLNNKCKFKNG